MCLSHGLANAKGTPFVVSLLWTVMWLPKVYSSITSFLDDYSNLRFP